MNIGGPATSFVMTSKICKISSDPPPPPPPTKKINIRFSESPRGPSLRMYEISEYPPPPLGATDWKRTK